MDKVKETRRTFLQKSGAASAAAFTAPMFVSQSVFGANDVINLGIIGPGRRANDLIKTFTALKDSQIVAISDVDLKRMDQKAGNNNWRKYQDYRKLLEATDVDAVVVATPDHWHALNSIHACMAGKDVYVEKPMTLDIGEGRAMVKAARKYGRIVQCGSQQRSSEKNRIACELIRNGAIGKVHTVHADIFHSPWDRPFPSQPVPDGLDWNAWIGPAPMRDYHIDIFTPRARPGWISLYSFSGGEATGWGAHGIDQIQWALGMDNSGPVEIWPEGNPRDLNRIVKMKYADGTLLVTDSKGDQGGGLFDGDKGSINIWRDGFNSTVENVTNHPIKEKLPVSRHHQQNWLDCIKSRELPIADVEIGHRSTTVCHMINLSRWFHRKVTWDPAKEIFVGDADANEYINRPRRKGFELPVL
jgi:predicted dehydrogenase